MAINKDDQLSRHLENKKTRNSSRKLRAIAWKIRKANIKTRETPGKSITKSENLGTFPFKNALKSRQTHLNITHVYFTQRLTQQRNKINSFAFVMAFSA